MRSCTEGRIMVLAEWVTCSRAKSLLSVEMLVR